MNITPFAISPTEAVRAFGENSWQTKAVVHHPVVDVLEILSSAPKHRDTPLPAIALAPLWARSIVATDHGDSIVYQDRAGGLFKWQLVFPWRRLATIGWRRTSVPVVPASFLPDRSAAEKDHYVLWEVEQWEPLIAPGDPYLLQHIGGSLFAVIAQWDVTPLEAALMKNIFTGERE